MGSYVVECLLELLHPMRLPNEEWMHREAHHTAALRTFHIEPIELRLDRIGVIAGGAVALEQRREVVDLQRVGNTDHATLADVFFFSSRRRHTRCLSDWSSDVCSSD